MTVPTKYANARTANSIEGKRSRSQRRPTGHHTNPQVQTQAIHTAILENIATPPNETSVGPPNGLHLLYCLPTCGQSFHRQRRQLRSARRGSRLLGPRQPRLPLPALVVVTLLDGDHRSEPEPHERSPPTSRPRMRSCWRSEESRAGLREEPAGDAFLFIAACGWWGHTGSAVALGSYRGRPSPGALHWHKASRNGRPGRTP